MKCGDLIFNIFLGKKEICVFIDFLYINNSMIERRLARILLPNGKITEIHEDYIRVIT